LSGFGYGAVRNFLSPVARPDSILKASAIACLQPLPPFDRLKRHVSNALTFESRREPMLRAIATTWIIILSTLVGPLAHGQSKAEDIVVGHTYPGTGFLGLMGNQMKTGLAAAFAEANAAGGVRGRRLRIIAVDDEFSEEKSFKNVQRLVLDEQALALMCPVGTNQIAKIKTYAEEMKFPVVGTRSGSESVRTYSKHMFFNHASFNDEVEFLARQLATVGIKNVSVGYVALPFGRDLYEGFKRSAAKHGLTIDKALPFGSNGEDIKSIASEVAGAKSHAHVLLGGGSGATTLVRELLHSGVKANTIYGMSVLSVQEVVRELGADSNGIVVSQVMPSPNADKLPLVKQYQAALKRLSNETPSAFGLEAYISGRILVDALKRIKGPITREAITASLENQGTLDLGGFHITYDASSRQGSQFVHLAIISHGQLRF